MKNMQKALPVCMMLAMMTMGCVGHDSKHPSETTAPVSRPANPAVKKCLEDGYIVEPVMENGVPVDHRCINPETDRACGVWEYYRKDCAL
ncbi:MAG: hypothetical protein LC660_11775 [Desulfobacteraceae bacterium]|nr:hypothetical protein [Desulfobacteraceae bacterium]